MIALARDRTILAAAAGLAAVTAVSWIGLAEYEPPFLVAWTLMMAAMMLPSIAPLALLYRGSRTLLAAGYLLVWAALGLLPYAAMEAELMPAVPLVLALAGAYELSPLKTACLRRCRGPADFVMRRYRHGALRIGIEHALWCTGCCAGLMAVLVLAAAMGLGWAALIAIAVFVQKVLPFEEAWSRVTGVVLLVSALVLEVT